MRDADEGGQQNSIPHGGCMSDEWRDRENSIDTDQTGSGKTRPDRAASADGQGQTTSGRQNFPRRTPTELQAPLLKTRPAGSTNRTQRTASADDGAASNRRQSQRSRTGSAAGRNAGTGAGSGSAQQRRRQETPEERERRIRRNRQRQKQQRLRQQRLRRLRMILIIAAVAVAGIVGITAIHRYRVKKAGEQAAAEAAAEAARTLQSYDASDVLHLSFHVLRLDDTTDADNDGIPDSEDDIIDSDGDGVADEGTDVDNDGIPDVHDDMIDADGDGVADDQEDVDGDGIPDSQDDLIDADGDGVADLTVDTDGDGIADAAAGTVSIDDKDLTVSEFNQILDELYQNNYVLVSPYQLATAGENGFTSGTVQVPKGKKPLIISEQDVNYSAGYDGSADSLMLTGDGTIVNSYTTADGNQAEGPVDVITCVDNFISSHADFSYNGARGIIGITGSNGIFGYAIDEDTEIIGSLSDKTIATVQSGTASGEKNTSDTASDNGDSSSDQTTSDGTDAAAPAYEFAPDESNESVSASSATTSSSSENSTSQAKAVSAAQQEYDAQIAANKSTLNDLITALRSEGWLFACNSYQNISYASSYDIVKADADSWKTNISPIVGNTDMLILPNGGDIGSWSGYSDSNQKYTYLKSLGFSYYFSDTTQSKTWLQTESGYVRQGMHDISTMSDYRNVMNM